MKRMKIEFVPLFMITPFIAVFFYLLLTNRTYWTLFNDTLGGVLGIKFNYVIFILILLGAIGFILLVFFVKGIQKISFLHKKGVQAFNLAIQTSMVGILVFVMTIEQRIDLGYLYFSLGPGLGLGVYLGVVIGTVVFLLVLLIGTTQLLHYSSNVKEEKSDGLRPKFVSYAVMYSGIAGLAVFLSIGFYYPKTEGYWTNISVIFQKYVNWTNGGSILVISGIALLIIHEILKKTNSSKYHGRVQKAGGLVSLWIIFSGLVWTSFRIENTTSPSFSGLWVFFLLFTLVIIALIYSPKIIFTMKNILAQSKSEEKTQENEYVREMDSNRKINKSSLTQLILMLLLIIFPFWVGFFQPLITGAPQVDIGFESRVEQVNGIAVPIQNGGVYPSFEMQNNDTRQYIDLGGSWRYKLGGGTTKDTLNPRNEIFVNKIATGEQYPDFSVDSWGTINIPNSYNQYEDEERYWGVQWYRKIINFEESLENNTVYLKFLGVNYFSDLWIDGKYIGYHEGGFTPFAFEISEHLTKGEHVLAMRVDTPKFDGILINKMIPDHADFFNYGGIYREVFLEIQPETSILRIDVQQESFEQTNCSEGNVDLKINVALKQPLDLETTAKTVEFDIGVYPLEFSTEDDLLSRQTWNYMDVQNPALEKFNVEKQLENIIDGGFGAYQFSLSLPDVDYWSTKNPNLYAVIVNLTNEDGSEVIDEFCTQTGFRELEINGTQLRLNGAEMKLAGMSIHEQYPAPTGRSLNDSQRFKDLLLVQNASSNWWRGSYPFHPMSYIYSDRLGMACWEEAPFFWFNEIDFVQAKARGAYKGIWTEVLFRDFNRPSILVWGACNEPWSTTNLYEYLQIAREFLDTYDSSRYLSFACVSGHPWNEGFKYLELLTPNTYGGTFDGVKGDYYGEISKQVDEFAANHPNKPLISMEWGKWRSGDDSDQVRCFEEGFQAISEHPNSVGMTWWVAFDYYGRDYYNTMGIYNMNRTWASPTFEVMNETYADYTANNK